MGGGSGRVGGRGSGGFGGGGDGGGGGGGEGREEREFSIGGSCVMVGQLGRIWDFNGLHICIWV